MIVRQTGDACSGAVRRHVAAGERHAVAIGVTIAGTPNTVFSRCAKSLPRDLSQTPEAATFVHSS